MVICRLYDSRLPIEPRYPATRPSVADLDVWDDENTLRETEEKRENEDDSDNSDKEDKINNDKIEYETLRHAPPGLVA